jgi:putative tryptophan/tyrosine transport system substrate-binding protein
VQAATATFGMSPVIVRAVTGPDLEPAFATLIQQRAEALDVEADPFFIGQAANLAALAIRYALPAIYGLREYVAAGGLISYGPASPTAIVRLASIQGVYSRVRSQPICLCSNQ